MFRFSYLPALKVTDFSMVDRVIFANNNIPGQSTMLDESGFNSNPSKYYDIADLKKKALLLPFISRILALKYCLS